MFDPTMPFSQAGPRIRRFGQITRKEWWSMQRTKPNSTFPFTFFLGQKLPKVARYFDVFSFPGAPEKEISPK